MQTILRKWEVVQTRWVFTEIVTYTIIIHNYVTKSSCNQPVCYGNFTILYTAVFVLPKVTDGPNKHIKTKLNDSISLQCQFRAPIGVTIVVWLKDNLPVKSAQH